MHKGLTHALEQQELPLVGFLGCGIGLRGTRIHRGEHPPAAALGELDQAFW